MNETTKQVVLYRAPDGGVALDVRLERDTVWLTQAQMVELFGRDQSVISRHLRNVFAEGELPRQGLSRRSRFPFALSTRR